MLRIILAQLRRRAARSVALLTGVLVATTGFTVLTGTVDTARLQVTQQVGENYRGAYDILVRPKGSRLEQENAAGLIRPSFLSDHFGGISLDQVATIPGVRGVEVAAPIAMIGISFAPAVVDLDTSAIVPRDDRSVHRITRTRITDGGTTRIPTPPRYHYFTPNGIAISNDPARQQNPVVEVVADGSVTGTLLGDAVSVRARGVGRIAVIAVLLLGLAAVADVLFVNVRDRAAELAALRATGWSAAAMARLVAYEGLGIGLVGAVLGAAAGLAGTAWFAGSVPPALVATAAVAAGAGVLATGLAALAPALAQQRIPVPRLLAEE